MRTRRPGRPPRSEGRDPPQEALLKAADALFYEQGISATGIDALARRAGVSKASIYQHYGSKSRLAARYVEGRAAAWTAWFAERMTAAPSNPAQRLMYVFDVLEQFIRQPGFCGCAFINAAADQRADRAVRGAAWDLKLGTRAALAQLCRDAGVAAPDELAAQIALLLDGALVAAMMSESADAAAPARTAAEQLLRSALRVKRTRGSARRSAPRRLGSGSGANEPRAT